MTEPNLYATPNAELDDPTGAPGAFYVVSIRKFVILFPSTLGMYSLYWFYAHWRNFKHRFGDSIWPVPRAIFNIFFVHSLYGNIRDRLKDRGLSYDWSPMPLATFFVVLSILSLVLDRVAQSGTWSPQADILGFLIMPLSMFAMIPAQKAANVYEEDPAGESNSSFTAANYLWVLLGLMLWLVTVFAMLVIFGVVPTDVEQ